MKTRLVLACGCVALLSGCSTIQTSKTIEAADLLPPEPYAEYEAREAARKAKAAEIERQAHQRRELARRETQTIRAGGLELYWEYADSDSGIYTKLDGTITNTGNVTVARVPIRVDVWDAEGSRVIDSDWTYVVDALPLRPGESRGWDKLIKKPTPRLQILLGKPGAVAAAP